MRGTTRIGVSEELRARGGAWVCTVYQLAEIRWSGCGPHLMSQYSQFIGDPLASPEASVASEAAAWRWCDPTRL